MLHHGTCGSSETGVHTLKWPWQLVVGRSLETLYRYPKRSFNRTLCSLPFQALRQGDWDVMPATFF